MSKAVLILSFIPYVFEGNSILSEESQINTSFSFINASTPASATVLNNVQSAKLGQITTNSINTNIQSSSVTVVIRLTSADSFFINKYSMFKALVESTFALQQSGLIPENLVFCTWIGTKEYMEYGVVQSCLFSAPNTDNSFNVTLTMLRRPYGNPTNADKTTAKPTGK